MRILLFCLQIRSASRDETMAVIPEELIDRVSLNPNALPTEAEARNGAQTMSESGVSEQYFAAHMAQLIHLKSCSSPKSLNRRSWHRCVGSGLCPRTGPDSSGSLRSAYQCSAR